MKKLLYHFDTDAVPSVFDSLEGAHIVFGAGKTGIQLPGAEQWQQHSTLKVLADANTAPPPSFDGINIVDKSTERFGKKIFGGIGIGALKLKLHRACMGKLFESNDQVLDAEAIYKIAQKMI